jgi:hypothetical protein
MMYPFLPLDNHAASLRMNTHVRNNSCRHPPEGANQELAAHDLVNKAIMLLPGEDNFEKGLAALHEATLRPDYDPAAAYHRVVTAGGFLAVTGNAAGGRRLHHASIGLLARHPGALDTRPSAQLAETLLSWPSTGQAA